MKQLTTLIFDVDGTLADTERDGHRIAFNAAFQHNNLEWDWDIATYGELLSVTGGKERIKYFLSLKHPDLLNHASDDSLLDWFECIGAGDIVPAKKPAPDIYHYVMQQLNLSPAECIAFEDSENGIHASLGAGLTTIISTNDYTRSHDFSGAALVLDQYGEADNPCQVINGPALPTGYLTIDDVIAIHQQSTK